MRRVVGAMLVLGLASGCSGEGAAMTPTVTVASSATITTTVLATTTTRAATTTTLATTSTRVEGAPEVDMVPVGYDVEDFVPLVENYFAVRNWALEHPNEATEEVLAMVIEPGSAEMQTTMAEIQDLLDQDAHYEGLSETFELRAHHIAQAATDIDNGPLAIGVTYRYGDTEIASLSGTPSALDSLRSLSWTINLVARPDGAWWVQSSLRNPPIYPTGS